MSLLRSRRLAPLLLTQTLGAVNDNMFKNALIMLVLLQAGAHGPEMVAAAGGVFILPYVLFSATAGQIADRYEKSRLIRAVKLGEILIMALGALGFLTGSLALLFGVLFVLGVQATFFSPLKFGIMPDHLAESELVEGNGLMEAGTFLGILSGTIAGGALYMLPGGPQIIALAGLGVAVAGLASSLAIPKAPARAPGLWIDRNIFGATRDLLSDAHAHRPVWLCILALSWFWVVGATLISELPLLTQQDLHADGHVVTLFLTVFSAGVGVGSVLCARLLGTEISARHVPFAALGISVFTWDFAHAVSHAGGLHSVAAILQSFAGWRALADLALLAGCGGLYSVPLYAVLQARAEAGHGARMIAANNVVNAAAMAVGAALTAGLAAAGMAPSRVLVLLAIANFAAAVWIIRVLPKDTLRMVFRWFFQICCGVRVKGLENLPAPGTPAVLLVNHQSFADGCFVGAFLPGNPLFAVNINTARRWWARPFLAAVRFFTVDQANPFSLKTMVEVVRTGETLVVFPEGRITKTGALMKVYDGAGMVADKAGAVVVPVHIDGLTFCKLSHMEGLLPRRWFPRLSLTVMAPLKLEVPEGLSGRQRRAAMGVIMSDAMEQAAFAAAPTGMSLFQKLLETTRRFGIGMQIVEDAAQTKLTYGRLILGAATLGRAIEMLVPAGEPVGVMLPNASGALVTFFALQAYGRVPAMLNFSAGADAMLGACTAAGVTTVLCSRAFVERGKLDAVVDRMSQRVRFIWLEDVRAGLTTGDKLRGLLAAKFPGRLPGARRAPHAPAVILFTSGSEGQPKGVVLSHRNILTNIAQVASFIDFTSKDRVFNAMPMFHSFGLTGATLFPLFNGVPTYFYPSPLHYRIVPELIYDTSSTIAFGTDTFLTGWARFAHPYDFYAMRYIVVGAEKVREETRRIYAEKFGTRLLEGYGATETAPVLALNSFMHNRPGSAGRLLPGIEYRLDPVEGIAEGGRLVVRGPNVMLGYLRVTAPTVLEPVADGWYDTGDVCTVDAARFVTIVGRAKRFAKIGGEMISMPRAEALALSLWPTATHAVVAVPDARKGEALVLLTTQPGAASADLLAHARAHDVPEIAVPRVVRSVPALPLLGNGKMDYVRAAELV